MLQSLLWLPLLLHYTSAEISPRSTVHFDEVLRLKCDTLLYRTVYHDSNCYFVIDAEINSSATSNSCSRVLPGAKLVGEASDPVWIALAIPENQFVRGDDSAGKKRAMCLFERRFSKVNSTRATTGKCARPNFCGYEKTKLTYILPMPFFSVLKHGIEPGQTLTFKGMTYAHSTPWTFAFHCKDYAKFIKNDAPLHITFNNVNGWVTFTTFHNGQYVHKENQPFPDSLRNKEFEIRIRAHHASLQLFINDKEFHTYQLRLPLSSITYFATESDCGPGYNCLTFNDGPRPDVTFHYIHFGEKYKPIPNESGITATGFSYCKTLFITGRIIAGANFYQINFLRNNETRTNREQTALIYVAKWAWNDQLGTSSLNDAQNGKYGVEQKELQQLFLRDTPFNLTIANEPRGFVILVNSKHYTTFAHRVCPSDITAIWLAVILDLTVEVSHATNCELPKENSGICAKKP